MANKSRCKIKIKDQDMLIALPYFLLDFLGTGLGSSETSSDGTKNNNICL